MRSDSQMLFWQAPPISRQPARQCQARRGTIERHNCADNDSRESGLRGGSLCRGLGNGLANPSSECATDIHLFLPGTRIYRGPAIQTAHRYSSPASPSAPHPPACLRRLASEPRRQCIADERKIIRPQQRLPTNAPCCRQQPGGIALRLAALRPDRY